MASDEFLRSSFVAVEVSEDFSEAVLVMCDGSRLLFRHRVGERWARAEGGEGLAGTVLAAVAQFRLNAKHLDIHFADGGRWEARFPGLPGLPPRT